MDDTVVDCTVDDVKVEDGTTELPKNLHGIIRSLKFKITVSVISDHIASE